MKNDSSNALNLALLRLKRAVETVVMHKKEAEQRANEVERTAKAVLRKLDNLISDVEEKR